MNNQQPDIAATVGRNLKVWRVRQGITQTEIAARLKISQGYFSRLELGKKSPSLRTLERLAGELGLTVSDLTAAGD
ncbi:MAG: helix-turn-helix domain-containing protein [Halochromatium sp.]